MKQLFKIYSFLFFLLSISLSAQELKEYKVEKGESLKDVAEKFDVNYSDLLRVNPGISKKPKKKTIVKIPGNNLVKIKHPVDLRSGFRSHSFGEVIKEKDSILLHKVSPKETLYSLSKQYKVSMSTLIKENPFLAVEGLNIGQELQIPVKKRSLLDVVEKTHVVAPQETMFGISKKYNVSIVALEKANADILVEGLKLGSVLKIPAVEEEKNPKEGAYIVSKGETLYSISRKHGISIAELLEVNDSLDVDSMTIGSSIQLPSKVVTRVTRKNSVPIYKETPLLYAYHKSDSLEVILNKLNITKDSLKSINPNFDSIIEYGGDLLLGMEKSHVLFQDDQWFKDSIIVDKEENILIMLPFNFKKNDTLKNELLFSNPNGLPSIVSDFYLGAAMAIDSLKKQGLKINTSIVDTEKSVDSIHEKMDELRTFKPSLIIGPLYTSNTMYVATQFPMVPVYYPIYTENQNRFKNRNIIKTGTPKSLFKKEILSFIQENRKGEHLIIVGDERDIVDLSKYKNMLVKTDSLGKIIEGDISLLTLSNGYISREHFLKELKLDQANWILIAENNNVIAADVFNNVRSIPRDSDLDTPMRILSFEKSDYINKVSYEDLATYNYTYATAEIEYDFEGNKEFENTYYKKNNAYPSNYAIRGFNVTYDAILRTIKGNKYTNVSGASSRYKQAFYYRKEGGNVRENQAVFVNSIESTNKEGLKVIRLR